MAMLHRENRYDRLVPTVEQLTGTRPMSIKEWVRDHITDFT